VQSQLLEKGLAGPEIDQLEDEWQGGSAAIPIRATVLLPVRDELERARIC